MTNRWVRTGALCMALLLGAGCASIPPEAPELSAQLGSRLSALEQAHVRLLEQFFEDRRRRVDEFVQEVWVPAFTAEFFADRRVDEVWKEVVKSTDPADRQRFIAMVGPRLQTRINDKRSELVRPLEELERTVKARLKADYDQARAINGTLTAFLQSASQVEANRKRYLEMLGVRDEQLQKVIDKTDEAVTTLIAKQQGAQQGVQNAVSAGQAFVDQVKAIVAQLRN